MHNQVTDGPTMADSGTACGVVQAQHPHVHAHTQARQHSEHVSIHVPCT